MHSKDILFWYRLQCTSMINPTTKIGKGKEVPRLLIQIISWLLSHRRVFMNSFFTISKCITFILAKQTTKSGKWRKVGQEQFCGQIAWYKTFSVNPDSWINSTKKEESRNISDWTSYLIRHQSVEDMWVSVKKRRKKSCLFTLCFGIRRNRWKKKNQKHTRKSNKAINIKYPT